MKEARFLFLAILFILIATPLVLAIDTEIKIKTLANHEVQATVYDPSSSGFRAFESFKATSDQYGDVEFVFSSNELKFNLIVYIKKDGEKIMAPEKFLDNSAGEHLDLRIAPSWFDFIETPLNGTDLDLNTTETDNEEVVDLVGSDDESNVAEEINQGSLLNETATPGITGAAIFGDDGILSKTFLYSLGIIIVIIVIGIIVFFILKRKRLGKGFKSDKLEGIKKESEEKIDDYKEIIEDAERKIKEAQEEIRKFKNQD
ncbi:MAG: hypothetical protein ACE5ES_02685, partial [Candidatus Nanoarchaeia archaeon]